MFNIKNNLVRVAGLYVSLFLFGLSSASYAKTAESPFSFSYDDYEPSAYSKKQAVINWDSEEGVKRLEGSKYKGDFFRLAHHFKYQEQPSTCGVATIAFIMGAVYEQRGEKFPIITSWPIPVADKVVGLEFRLWTESNVLNEKTDQIVDRRSIILKLPSKKYGQFMGGIDMSEVKDVLKVHGVKSDVFQAKTSNSEDIEQFRTVLKSTLNDKTKFLIANYHRGYQNIERGGHFSPIAAYDEASDSILILDVAAHRNPWIWVNVADFYKSMNSKNYAGNSNRGYMIVYVK